MAAKRSTQLVIIGVSVFIIGAGLVFVGLHSHGSTAKAATAPASATSAAPAARSIVTTQSQGNAVAVSVPIPKGMQAVAVQLDAVPGLAGYAKPGDLVDLYATVKSGPALDAGSCSGSGASSLCRSKSKKLAPYARLLLANVKVLDLSGTTPDKGGDGKPVFLLALSARDAEKVIFVAKFESLWASLVPSGQSPAHTSGRDYLTIQ